MRQLQHQTRLNDDAVTRLAHGYEAGEPVRELLRRFDINRDTLYKHLKRCGVEPRRLGLKLTAAQVSRAAKQHRAGDSLAVLGERYGVDSTTVADALRRAGVEIRHRGRLSRTADGP